MYNHILFGSDLLPESLTIGEKASQLAKIFGANLSIIHVIEPPISYRDNTAVLSSAFDELKENAGDALREFSKKLNIEEKNQHLDIGTPKFKIVDKAKELKADLLVVASHGGGGFRHAMGSTSQGIINAIPCDILVFNINTLTPIKIKDDRIF